MASLPFSLMRDVFASRFEIQESDLPPVARENLSGLVALVGLSGDALGRFLARAVAARTFRRPTPLDFSTSPYLRELLTTSSKPAIARFITWASFSRRSAKLQQRGAGF
jgi:hypothetical protein